MTKPSVYRGILCALAVCFSLVCAYQTKAQTLIDPATLHIGAGAGTPCAMGCGGDPNPIGSGNTVDVFQNSNGAPALKTPLLLILSVPNDTTNLFASNPISGVSFTNPYPGGSTVAGTSAFATAGTYGLKSAVSGGFFGVMGPGQEVYSFLTLTGPADKSNSFTNFSGVDQAQNGITATGFGVYAFALSGGKLGPNGLANITFGSGALPRGTFVDAYGQTNTKLFDTPFTESGLTNTTPEPASMLLLGTGFVAFGGMLRRRKSEKSVVA